ncbi:MAG: type II secretion system F family protein [Nitrospiraceae bacterium]|nr:type II secretion system F family protein [Nitrospiraceae bacterium]
MSVLGGVKETDVLRSMQYMLDAGMSMHEIIAELANTIDNKRIAAKLEVVDDLMTNEGYKFADALESAGLFEQFTPIIRTGQETGSLAKVINDIIVTADKVYALKRKVKTMVIYPVLMMFLAIALGFGISFLLEKVLTSLPEKDIKGTAAYSVARFIVSYRGVIFPAYALGLAASIWIIGKNASRIPGVRGLFNTMTVGQTFKMISLCISSGLPLKETFELTSLILKEKRWRKVMDLLSADSQERNFYDLVDELSDFISTPDLLIIKSNIKAGNMSYGFDFVGEKKIADSYSLIERASPLMQIAAYFFVAGQVVAVMSPLYVLLIGFAGKV